MFDFRQRPHPAETRIVHGSLLVVAIGISGFMPTNVGAGVADLPPERLWVGGAVSNALRQVGSAFGVALLVAVVGTPTTPSELVDAHRNGYLLEAIVMLIAAALSGWQTGRPRRPTPHGP